jgi:hypothetical protein
MLEPFVVLFPLIPLPNLLAKGLNFGVFLALGLEVFLVGFFRNSSRFSKFWWTKSWLWSAHEVFLLSPKSHYMKTHFGNERRSPLVMGNVPVTNQVLQTCQER